MGITRKTRIFQSLFFWLLCCIICFFILYTFISISGVNNLYRAEFGDMIYGTAYRPYVSRVLIPGFVRLTANVIPDQLRSGWSTALENNLILNSSLISFKSGPGLSVEAVLTWALMFLSLLGFSAAFRNLLTSQYRISSFATDMTTLSALFILVVFFGFGYIYDFTTLFLFTLQLNWIARDRLKLLLFTFPIVCLNKETSILLIMLMAIYGWNQLPRMVLTRILAVQIAIFVIIKLSLSWLFRANPGSATEFHFYDHFTFATKFPVILIGTTIILAGILFLLVKGWHQKPLFLRKAIFLLLPLSGLYFLFGFPMEFRAMYEVYPIIIALSLPTILPRVRSLEAI